MKIIDIKNNIEKILDKNKASNITSINLKNKSYIADYMIIASGTSSRHLQALSEILVSELKKIGLSDNSSLRKSLMGSLSKLDNGGFKSDGVTKCDAAKALDVVYLLVKDSADNTTSYDDLKNANLLKYSDITSSVNGNATTSKPAALSSVTMDKVRLIYASNTSKTTYTDSYEAAYSSMQTAIKNTRSLGTETSTKGDGKVILRELVCAGDN